MVRDDGEIRERLLSQMAIHVLAHGLNDASLRPLARAAGTSDRMLIYHFGNKERLVADLLIHLSGMFRTALDASLPPGRFASERAGAEAILAMMRQDAARGFVRVWFDILAASTRGSANHRTTGHTILSGLHAWLAARMPDGPGDPETRAADLLVRIEGMMVAEEVGVGGLVATALDSLPG